MQGKVVSTENHREQAKPVPATPKRATKKAAKVRRAAESMARLWSQGMDGRDELSKLCSVLGEGCALHETAQEARALVGEEAPEMMEWLRWRMTWETYLKDDGTRLCTDMFVIPFSGDPMAIAAFVSRSSFGEDMVSLVRRAGIASLNAQFAFMALPVPLIPAVGLTLDALAMLRTSLEWGLVGNDGLVSIQANILSSMRAIGHGDAYEMVVFGVRTELTRNGTFPRDMFHDQAEETTDAGYRAWGDLASGMGLPHGVFIGLPGHLDSAISFLAASRVHRLLNQSIMYVAMPKDADIDIDNMPEMHVCEHATGLWVSQVRNGVVLGPVHTDNNVALSDHEVFMDSLSEGMSDMVYHDNVSDLPGMRPSPLQLLN